VLYKQVVSRNPDRASCPQVFTHEYSGAFDDEMRGAVYGGEKASEKRGPSPPSAR